MVLIIGEYSESRLITPLLIRVFVKCDLKMVMYFVLIGKRIKT